MPFIAGHKTTDFRSRPDNCPACGRPATAATSAAPGEHTPEPGSVSLCFGCGSVSLFDENLRLRPLTEAEAAELEQSPAAPEIARMQHKIHERNKQQDNLPELGKRVVRDTERMWGHLRNDTGITEEDK
jgi:hypothetical protein